VIFPWAPIRSCGLPAMPRDNPPWVVVSGKRRLYTGSGMC
jgi:hypothetical protein